MAYLLDANVFIQAHRLHYSFDFCPAFWDWLVVKNNKGVVFINSFKLFKVMYFYV
jgi:hypothetical protein